jgi:hypothetical protein
MVISRKVHLVTLNWQVWSVLVVVLTMVLLAGLFSLAW